MKILLPLINKFKARKHQTVRENPTYDRAEKIGLLILKKTVDEEYEMEGLIQKILSDGKSVATLTLVPAAATKENPSKNQFTTKDISFWGHWKNKNVSDFYETAFDFLIYPELVISPITENILLSSQAKCRVGFFMEESSHLFELMIKPINNLRSKDKLQEIYNCLHRLK